MITSNLVSEKFKVGKYTFIQIKTNKSQSRLYKPKIKNIESRAYVITKQDKYHFLLVFYRLPLHSNN